MITEKIRENHDRNSQYIYPESRFRDRRGREHYDNGRFAPMGDGGYGPYSRYDGGSYDPFNLIDERADGVRGDYGSAHYPIYPYVPPVYRGNEDMRYHGDRPMGKIGFSMDGEIGRPWEMGNNYRMDAGYMSGNEMEYRKGDGRVPGYGTGDDFAPLNRETAEIWVAKMQNADGSTGAHWTLDQTKQLQSRKGISLDPVSFWIAMNMMYSDYFAAADKAGIGTDDFYADMAKAFLDDKDAQTGKLSRYFRYIAKH